MDRELIIQTLDAACKEKNFRFQVITEPSLLHIYINRKRDRLPDYAVLSETIKNAVLDLNFPDLEGLWLYSRIRGEIEPDWDTFIELVPCPVTIGEAPDSIANSKCNSPPAAIEKVAFPEIENVSANSEPEPNDEEDIAEEEMISEGSRFASYCFIANKGLLANKLLPPQLKIARIVRFLHDLPEHIKPQILPLLQEYFKTGKCPDISELSIGIQNWFGQLTHLSQPETRKAAIWLSRYCFDPETTMSQIQEVFEAEAVKKKTEAKAKAKMEIEEEEAECEIVSLDNNDVLYRRRHENEPRSRQARSLDANNNILLLPMAWIIATLIFVILGVNIASSPAGMSSICQQYSGSVSYCQLAVNLTGEKNIDKVLTKTDTRSFTTRQEELGAYACQRYANVKAGVPFKDADPQDTPAISSKGQKVLNNLYAVTATQKNFRPEGNAKVRVGCVYASDRSEKFPVLLASDTIPNNWPQETYQPSQVALSPQSFSFFWLPIFLGISTIFATVGISIAAAFGLGFRVDRLQTIYIAALILSIVESATVDLPVFGLAANVALQSLALGITSMFIKGFKIDWTMGYKVVAAGAVAIMGTKWVMRWIFYLLLYSLLN